MKITKLQIKEANILNKYNVSYDTEYVINQITNRLMTKKAIIDLIRKSL
jgi:hypothetical protein